ncbi:MAG TPA: hypothetical protein VH763_17770 [Gemmatimonadales bacterium]|jgi:hypothetical protein
MPVSFCPSRLDRGASRQRDERGAVRLPLQISGSRERFLILGPKRSGEEKEREEPGW